MTHDEHCKSANRFGDGFDCVCGTPPLQRSPVRTPVPAAYPRPGVPEPADEVPERPTDIVTPGALRVMYPPDVSYANNDPCAACRGFERHNAGRCDKPGIHDVSGVRLCEYHYATRANGRRLYLADGRLIECDGTVVPDDTPAPRLVFNGIECRGFGGPGEPPVADGSQRQRLADILAARVAPAPRAAVIGQQLADMLARVSAPAAPHPREQAVLPTPVPLEEMAPAAGSIFAALLQAAEGFGGELADAIGAGTWGDPPASVPPEPLTTPPMYAINPPAKESNPKDAVANDHVKFSAIPLRVLAGVAVAMSEGAWKYRRHNYRVAGVRASVYFDATLDHLFGWFEGEDIDPDSGRHHIDKAIASLFVLRDAMLGGMVTDDRPPAVRNDWIKEAHVATKELFARMQSAHGDHKPPYVIGDR